ncbi:DUF222 domain-containing protein [Microbacterium sp. AZCO]|uniref:HNH endonuclease n=1 Tax=Microbacterium sp. AZCO TaxID=3142976 RepID=UPI0031F3ECE5
MRWDLVDDDVDDFVPDVPDALDQVVEVADMMSILAAQQLVHVDSVREDAFAEAARHGRQLNDVLERSVRLELATALGVTEYAAQELMRLSDALVHRYPQALESLGRARMTQRHASILADAMDGLEPDVRAEVLPQVIELAETEAVGSFRRRLRKLIDEARFVTVAERHEAAVAKRREFVEPAEDGMAFWGVYAPAVEVHAGHQRLTAMAKVIAADPDETRTLDQIRADVFCDLMLEGRTDLHPEQAQGIRASVNVTVPVLALLEDDTSSYAGEAPVVEGVGPIPVERARELCGSAPSLMRILTEPETGMVLSVGRDQYPVPPGLRRLVKWRADRCMAPGCSIPASRCEIDHSLAWEHGGHTSLGNLCPLCKGHHTVKHHGGWTVRQIDGSGGALEWISPAGRRYVVQPERRVPVFTVATSAEGQPPF